MNTQSTVEAFKALGDDIRLGIVRELALQSQPVASCDIVQACASRARLSQPAMSHHFGKLVDAGVLVEEKQGTQKQYSVDAAYLASLGIDVTKL